MGTAQATFVEVLWGATGNDMTGSDVNGSGADRKWRYDRSMFCTCATNSRVCFLTISSSTVVQVPWLPEVTQGHVTPSGFPWVRACAIESCAISALVGPFDRKWRYETSPRSDRRSPEGVCPCATGSCAISALVGPFWPEVPLVVLSMTSASIIV